jgi:CRP-like cAMP-binding protein
MHLGQKDLFWGMDIEVVKQITELAVHNTYKMGDKIFSVGEKADHFYVLLKGSVTMERGTGKWHNANNPGELFGWSALINRGDYAAQAVATVESEILKIEREAFLNLLEQSQKNKAILFEHLARMLGNQLLEVYLHSAV